jgi:uronate dehydrogenase
MKRILITGANGKVGRRLRHEIAACFECVRVMSRGPIADLLPREEAVTCDITDIAAIQRAMEGIEGVLHLAAISDEAPWEPILQTNIIGTYNLYEAARRQGVERVVFGSTYHVVGFYPRSQVIDHTVPLRPDTRYALSKCWGEAVASLYAEKYGVRSLLIRIGNADDLPADVRRLSVWISARDLAQLVLIGFNHPEIHNEIVYGISNNAAAWHDNSAAFRLGYRPLDRAEDYRDFALEGEKSVDHDAVGLYFQGGPFCADEYANWPLHPRESNSSST